MTQVDFGDTARDIIRRLAAVNLSSVKLDRERADESINNYLRWLGLPPRAVRWADGPAGGMKLARGLNFQAEKFEISRALGEAAKRPGKLPIRNDASDLASVEAARAGRSNVWWALDRALGDREFEAAAVTPEGGDTPDADAARLERQLAPGAFWEYARHAATNATMAAREYAGMHACDRESEANRAFASIWGSLLEGYEAGLWIFLVATEAVVAVPRPELSLRDDVLHREGGPAAVWPDGDSYYFLNGVRVTREIAVKRAAELDPRLLPRIRNAEVRREFVRKVGIERILEGLGAKRLDARGDYELLLLDLGDGRRRPFLKMRNPSVGVYHVEGVHPDCNTVAEALTWRNGTSVPPSILT